MKTGSNGMLTYALAAGAAIVAWWLTSGFGWLIGLILAAAAAVAVFYYLSASRGDAAETEAEAADDAPPAPVVAPVVPSPPPAAGPEVEAGTDAETKPAAGNWTDSVQADSGRKGAGGGQTGLKPSNIPAEEETLRDGVGGWKYKGA